AGDVLHVGDRTVEALDPVLVDLEPDHVVAGVHGAQGHGQAHVALSEHGHPVPDQPHRVSLDDRSSVQSERPTVNGSSGPGGPVNCPWSSSTPSCTKG